MKGSPNRVYSLFITLLLSQLAGCATIDVIPEQAFGGSERAIQIGSTTRAEIQSLLGLPDNQDPLGRWDVYRTETDGVRLVSIVPFSKLRMWSHYLLITYDAQSRVSDVGMGRGRNDRAGRSDDGYPTLYAGGYGYHTASRTAFTSLDNGGQADFYWAAYLTNSMHEVVQHRFRGYVDALSFLCEAARQGHPCAHRELGNSFWGAQLRGHDFDNEDAQGCGAAISSRSGPYREKDRVKACVWYSMANGKVLPARCWRTLSAEEILIVERLLIDSRMPSCE